MRNQWRMANDDMPMQPLCSNHMDVRISEPGLKPKLEPTAEFKFEYKFGFLKSIPARFYTNFLSVFLTIIFSLTMNFAFGQTPYSGGSGDGYGRVEFGFIGGDPGLFVPSLIYPSLVGEGESITVRAEGVRNKLEIIVHTLTGAFQHRNVAWGIVGTHEQKIGIDGWAAGVYVVDVRVDGRAYRHKLIVMRKQ